MQSRAQASTGVSAFALDNPSAAVSTPSKVAGAWSALNRRSVAACEGLILQQGQCPMQILILQPRFVQWMASGWHLDFESTLYTFDQINTPCSQIKNTNELVGHQEKVALQFNRVWKRMCEAPVDIISKPMSSSDP